MRYLPSSIMLCAVHLLALPAAAETKHFAWDSIGGTLARDHQSRAMYFEGQYKRTYVAYMDHSFFARITYYDHDKKAWLYPPVLLDDCIRPDKRFNNAVKDGHNVPNLFITSDGTIHIFYGAHGTAFRYARTKRPESIEPRNWTIDMRVGKEGTYPFFAETKDRALYVFYRYSPTGGYNNPFLGMQMTRDNGKTWSDIKKLATFPDACKLHRGAYDPVADSVHLLIHPRGRLGGRRGAVHCIYDPNSGKLLALNGKTLGPMGTVKSFQENLPKIFHRMVGFVLHEGTPYFLYRDKESRIHFGYWQGGQWVDVTLAKDALADLVRAPIMYTSDGKHFKAFGIADWADGDKRLRGGDIKMWESSDRGATWTSGKVVADRKQFGHGFQDVNKVMNYAGHGPFFVASEPTGQWPEGWKKTIYTHYDNPSRRDKKLYAFDIDGNVIPRVNK